MTLHGAAGCQYLRGTCSVDNTRGGWRSIARMMNRYSLALLFASLGMLSSGVARAQPRACSDGEVTAQIERALADRRAGRALPGYDRLNSLWQRCPSPRVRAQLAMAEQGLLRWSDAYVHLQEALASLQDSWVSAHRDTLEGALREIQRHLPSLAPQTNVPGAVLIVDGVRVGALPLEAPHPLPSGHATIELTAPGHQPLRRVVSLAEDEVFREMLTLERVPAVLAPPSRARQVTGWTFVGVGAVLGALGVWQALLWSSQGTETADATESSPGALGAWARFDRVVNPGDLTPTQVCERAQSSSSPDATGARELCDESTTHSAMALGFGIGGAALAVTGAVLVATSGGGASERRGARLGPWFTAGVRGASLQLQF